MSNSDFEFRDDATIQAVFSMEVGREQNNHNFLYNRSFPNQHPIEAITGLREELDGNAGAIAAEETRAKGVEGNLENLTTQNKENLVSAINEIEEKIPDAASSINQLVDKAYVDNADKNLQQQIDVMSASSDVTDIVGTYAELQEYDTAKLKNNDIIKVLQDETQDDAISYYRWTISGHVGSFSLIGIEGPYYTKAAANITFVPQSRTINSKELTADIELNYTDVGADAAGAASSAETNAKNYADSLSSNYATSAQGVKADTALQQSDVISTYSSTGTAPVNGTAVASAISNKANVGLDNLSSDGQKIVDTANGTISNCILEIPQNIKLEQNGNTFTFKAGSIFILYGDTYSTITTINDGSVTLNPIGDDAEWYLVASGNEQVNNPYAINVNKFTSGNSEQFPTSNLDNDTFYYNVDTKTAYRYNTDTQQWGAQGRYPSAIVQRKNNQLSIKCIFNGAGFIGHHAVVYPNVKYLLSNGFTNDKTLDSDTGTLDSLQILELVNNRDVIALDNNLHLSRWKKVEKDKSLLTSGEITYVASENLTYGNNGSSIAAFRRCFFVDYVYNATIVTDFTIRQPYDGARYLLMDEIKKEVATKQNDITTITGYDATKSQTLKNVSGILTWIDD